MPYILNQVRLNEPETYDKSVFSNAGFNFYDMYFDDCTIPPAEIIEEVIPKPRSFTCLGFRV
jgi:hypothetical protein